MRQRRGNGLLHASKSTPCIESAIQCNHNHNHNHTQDSATGVGAALGCLLGLGLGQEPAAQAQVQADKVGGEEGGGQVPHNPVLHRVGGHGHGDSGPTCGTDTRGTTPGEHLGTTRMHTLHRNTLGQDGGGGERSTARSTPPVTIVHVRATSPIFLMAAAAKPSAEGTVRDAVLILLILVATK